MFNVKYKILVTDIDGTFSKQERIFVENISYLKWLKSQGIILVANTGRGIISGDFILNIGLFDYLIGNDGSFIYDINKSKLIMSYKINKNDANKIIQIANKGGIAWVAESLTHVYFANHPITHSHEFLKHSLYKFQYVEIVPENINRILLIADDCDWEKFTNKFKKFPNIFPKKFNCFWNERTWEITNHNCSKGHAVQYLMTSLNIKMHKLLVVGDSINDISMLKLSHKSIAMGNANPEVKEIANFITDSEKNYGWLKGLKKYE